MMGLPDRFLWGVATAAYQVEGAASEDGRGPSVWDTFSHQPGRVHGGHTGDTACDHYHRWQEDLDLVAGLGVDAYRFSIGWSRVMPDGRTPNRAGLDFYDRLVDGILERGLLPLPTLNHWDLPQALEDAGGWPVRATAEAFADYAEVVATRLGDRLPAIATHNEPWVVMTLGYIAGAHAPGRTSLSDGLAAGHHLLVGHGLAAQRIRAEAPTTDVGIVLNLIDVQPASAADADVTVARTLDAEMNRWFLDPLAGRGYPAEGHQGADWPDVVRDGDLDLIATPLDWLGINYYMRLVAHGPIGDDARPAPIERVSDDRTDMGWEVYPDGLAHLLVRLADDYPQFPRLVVTENGSAWPEPAHVDGPIADHDRIRYLDAHVDAVRRAQRAGAPVSGYLAWTLLDNFEWTEGYDKRFGLVHVDATTLDRTPKASYAHFRELVAAARGTWA
jgi:beta-glucosidase